MQLTLKGVIPTYLLDKPGIHQSGVWGRDLVMNEGEGVFVQAASGAGKTTFVHILYGLQNASTGPVRWDTIEPAKADDESLATLRAQQLSIIFQDLRMFPTLTALENIDIKRAMAGTVSEAMVNDWFERLGMAGRKDSLAATLSYGERQRVAILRALVQPFRWLLMDEPFSHLDIANREKAIDLVAEVVKDNKAGLLLADLNANNYFPYTQTLMM